MIAKTLAGYGVARLESKAAREPRLPCPGDNAQPCLSGGYVADSIHKKRK
jgi:hypothetical protein